MGRFVVFGSPIDWPSRDASGKTIWMKEEFEHLDQALKLFGMLVATRFQKGYVGLRVDDIEILGWSHGQLDVIDGPGEVFTVEHHAACTSRGTDNPCWCGEYIAAGVNPETRQRQEGWGMRVIS